MTANAHDDLAMFAGDLRLIVAPRVGGSIARFDRIADGAVEPVLRGADGASSGPLDCGCFPLVPFSNRIRGGGFSFRGREVRLPANMDGDPSPIHGFGWQVPWQVEAADDRAATLRHHHAGGDWPWPYEARQVFALDQDGLTARIECRNLADAPMPCGLGFHPYFPCATGPLLNTQVSHVWTIDADVLPVERIATKGRYALDGLPACGRDLDNGYEGWGGVALIRYPDRGFDVRMSSADATKFQLYSPADASLFVAEPVSHRNDALSEPEEDWAEAGMRVLAPGETMTLTMRIDVLPHE